MEDRAMPFWGSETLRSRVSELVTPSDAQMVTQSSIELRMGREAFVTGRDGERIELDNDGKDFVIPPGQFAQLLTLERVRVPLECIAFISIKFRHKLRGLVNVSGFHVDPGYNGWLILSVYNAGSKQIRLSRGEATFLIWYAELDKPIPEKEKYYGGRGQQERIPDEYIMEIDGDIASPGSLERKIRKLQSKTTHNRFLMGVLIAIVVAAVLAPEIRAFRAGQSSNAKPERGDTRAAESVDEADGDAHESSANGS